MPWKAEAVSPEREGSCPTCGGRAAPRCYGELYGGWHLVDGQRVEFRGLPPQGYGDPIYLDLLTQYYDGGLYRMWPSERYLSRGGARLHRGVWSAWFGPVPRGCHIHHIDGDVLNNAITNLECLPASHHLSLTWHENNKDRTTPHFGNLARKKSADWHRSEEGLLWHRRHAAKTKAWTIWRREPADCLHCGVTFDAVVRKSGYSQVYCTSSCKAAAYRARRAKTRLAPDCGRP